MSGYAWFAEGFAAGVLVMSVFIWLVSALVRIESAERDRKERDA